LFRIKGLPAAKQFDSYPSLINDVKWSVDSRSLVFLLETLHRPHHLYQVSLAGRSAIDITPDEKDDIIEPTSCLETSVYLVSPSQIFSRDNRSVVSSVLTGKSIFNVLSPDTYPDPSGIGPGWKMRIRFRGKTSTFPSGKNDFFPDGAARIFSPSISPNGSFVLTAVPVAAVPPSWSAYWSGYATRRFAPSNALSDRSGKDVFWPWQYALINLVTGKTEPVFKAPTGFTMSAGTTYEAKWSRSGDNVIATYTYLPLDPIQLYTGNSIRPCAIAEYSLKTHTTICVAMTPPPEQGEFLVAVDYDASDDIVAQWTVRGKQVKRRYDRTSEQWIPLNDPSSRPQSLEIYILQDIDVRPTLWVRRGYEDRLLWDPNPQLRTVQFGKGSLYQWTDTSGHTWRGGLVLPVGPKPQKGYPLVIQTHGFYNEHEFLVDGAFTTGNAAQPLACAGIAVLQMEDRPDKHSRPPEGEADDAVKGFESAIDHLAEEHIIDTSRVGIQGFSRTSWYVEEALEHSPERYKAAIIIDGVDMSYVQDVIFTPGFDEFRRGSEGANDGMPFGAGLSKWLNNAAGFHLDKIKAAVRLEAHGVFSVLGEWEIYSILQQQGKPVDLIDIPHGQHILQMPKERYASQQGAVDWFRFWLQDYMRDSPEVQKDYKRWNTFRSPVFFSEKKLPLQ
jgi:dipeptidyl aminopeptidase/acylaminoacyl peptidase